MNKKIKKINLKKLGAKKSARMKYLYFLNYIYFNFRFK